MKAIQTAQQQQNALSVSTTPMMLIHDLRIHRRACLRCHGQKLRCRRERLNSGCLRCQKAKVECVSRPIRSRQHAKAQDHGSMVSSPSSNLDASSAAVTPTSPHIPPQPMLVPWDMFPQSDLGHAAGLDADMFALDAMYLPLGSANSLPILESPTPFAQFGYQTEKMSLSDDDVFGYVPAYPRLGGDGLPHRLLFQQSLSTGYETYDGN